jgi:NAD(P)-dependent dehydrogenase (short-subunit alcohol dehydrogenase family)
MTGVFDLSGRRAMVTGGARGIGAAIVRALAGAGVRTAVADLDLPAARALAAELGAEAMAIEIDVRDRT